MRNKLIRLAASTIVAGVMASIVLNAMPQAAIAATTATEDFDGLAAGHPAARQDNGWTYTGGGATYDIGMFSTHPGERRFVSRTAS